VALPLTLYHRSIEFLSDYGAHALCCPLQRVPVARIAAAQTEIRATNRCEPCAAYRIRGAVCAHVVSVQARCGIRNRQGLFCMYVNCCVFCVLQLE
jgi:hypothetical protein